MNKNALAGLYENLRVICYQLPGILNDFENGFGVTTDFDRKISQAVKDSVKTSMAIIFDSTELIYKLTNAEEESDFKDIIGVDNGRMG